MIANGAGRDSFEESVRHLAALGFTDLEAAVYVYLVENSPATAYRVAQGIGKPVANTYKAVESLQQKGAVLVDETKTRLCRAVPPDDLLGRLEKTFETRREAAAQALARLQPAVLDLVEVLRRVIEVTKPVRSEAAQTLSATLPDKPLYVDADAMRLEQVFGNLLVNATKYTRPQGRIWVTAELEAGPTPLAVVRVRDNGMGIEAALLPRIFDLFVQGEGSPDRARAGVGLGLTLAKRLVELHGGTIEAHSAGNALGSEFIVRLPLARPEARPPAAPGAGAPRAAKKKRTPPGTHRRRQRGLRESARADPHLEGPRIEGRRRGPRGGGGGEAVQARRDRARYRPAGHERLRGGASAAPRFRDAGSAHHRGDRLRAGRGSRSRPGRRHRHAHDQARGAGGAARGDRKVARSAAPLTPFRAAGSHR